MGFATLYPSYDSSGHPLPQAGEGKVHRVAHFVAFLRPSQGRFMGRLPFIAHP